jgi:hypothetical protein
MKINENFRYAVHIDQWAIIEYFKNQKKDLERVKLLKGRHYMILGFIIGGYLATGLKNKEIKGATYTWMGNSHFFDNLPLVFIRSAKTKQDKEKEYLTLKRNLQNYLDRLIEFGFIYREIENETRYLRVDNVLLSKCNKGPNKVSPLDNVNKYFKKELLAIQKEYVPQLPNKIRYEKMLKKFFFDEEWDHKDDLFIRLRKYLDECVKDPYYKIKAS